MFYRFNLLQKFSDRVAHAVFSRNFGVSSPPYNSLNVRYGIGDSRINVDENRKIILEALGFKRLVSANQTHSNNVLVVDDAFLNLNSAGMEPNNVDALVTNVRGVALMIQVADCQAILIYDPKKQVVAGVHAGHRGLAKDISLEVINIMRANFSCNSDDLIVCISPSLGPKSAFFSNPKEELPVSFEPFIDSKKRVNLWEFSVAQLESHGIRQNNIELMRVCTKGDDGKNFFSFRRENGITGRFGVVIGLPEL